MEYVNRLIGAPEINLRKVFYPLAAFTLHLHDNFIPHHRNNYHPHLLGHRSLALMSALLLSVKIFTISAATLGPIESAFSSAITQENIVKLTNQSRILYGLNELKPSGILDQAAQTKAEDMLTKGYFSHNTPDGQTPWDFIISAGYNYLMAGENLAVNFTEAENVEEAWMNSPGHKANILNKNFEEIGIGIAQGQYQGNTAIFVVQMFGTPVEQKIALLGQPTLVQKTAVPEPAVVAQADPILEESLKPQTLGEQNQPEPLAVAEGQVKLEGEMVKIEAKILGPAVKVIAYFGREAVMLSPKSDNLWTGQVDLQKLAAGSMSVKLKAFDIKGQSAELRLADFSPNIQKNYNLSGNTGSSKVSILNFSVEPKNFEQRVYLFFIAGLLATLILAIAIKRHIQHLSLIANTSFVVIFAALLFWAG